MSGIGRFDAVVIGGGPGGATAAVRLAAHGLAVALIEDRLVGGECHYWACNPTKTLIRPIEVLQLAKQVRQGKMGAQRVAGAPLQFAEQAIEIAQEAQGVAEEDLRVIRERYRVGVATIRELVTSQIAAVQAGVNVVTSRYDYVLARARLEAVLGRGL